MNRRVTYLQQQKEWNIATNFGREADSAAKLATLYYAYYALDPEVREGGRDAERYSGECDVAWLSLVASFYCVRAYVSGCPKCSCRFLVGGARIGLNTSERPKTNCKGTYCKRRYLRHIWVKIWLRYVIFWHLYSSLNTEGNKVHEAFNVFLLSEGKNAT